MSFHPNDVSRRARTANIILVVAFALLVSKFFSTQVRKHEEYALQSEENRLREVPLPAPRGIIYDRNGRVIAENLPGYTVSLLSPTPDSLRSRVRHYSRLSAMEGKLLKLLRSHRWCRTDEVVAAERARLA